MQLEEKGALIMKADVHYLTAKLEEIHLDVKQLQEHVDILRQESTGRKALTKVLLGGMSVLSVVLGWVITVLFGRV